MFGDRSRRKRLPERFGELNRQSLTMANLQENDLPMAILPRIRPKTNRKYYRNNRPLKGEELRHSNKENVPLANFTNDNCANVKVHGLRNRSSNSSQRNDEIASSCPQKPKSDKSDYVDCLTDSSHPRALQDLSRHFGGAKNIGKEMRQIAGTGSGSQGGLKNFFSQYPSLFTIDGEYVTITCYNSSNGTKSTSTSCEAGSSSGKTTPSAEAMLYFRNKLEQYGEAEVPLRCLLGHRSQATATVRQTSGQNLKEFQDFLSQHPETFVIHNDCVILRKHWDNICGSKINPDGDVVINRSPESQLVACVLNLCHSIVGSQGATSVDNLYNQLCLKSKFQSNDFQVHLPQLIKNACDLELTLKDHPNKFVVQNGVVYLISSELSSNTGATSASTPAVSGSTEPLVINSPTLVLTTSPNSVMSINQNLPSPSHILKQRMETKSNRAIVGSVEPTLHSFANISGHADGCDVEAKSFLARKSFEEPLKIVTSVKECQALKAHLKTLPLIAFAAEGVNLGPMGPMTLFQIGTANGRAFILDIQTCKELLVDGGIKEILESSAIVKVTHDCRNSSAALYYQFGISLENVFDTQAAHTVIVSKTANKPEHKVKNISLSKIHRMYGPHTLAQTKKQISKYKKDQKFWNRRPLTDEIIAEAAADISSLVPNVYETMSSLLNDETSRQLFNQLCWEQVNYFVKVDDVRFNKKQRKIEFEVGELKSKLSRMTGHVVLSNREIRLLRFVNLNDQERSKLEDSYKLSDKLQRFHISANGLMEGSSSEDGDSFEISESYKKTDELNGERYDLDSASVANSENVGCLSSYSSMSPSFEETIRIVEEFLANDRQERLAKGKVNEDAGNVLQDRLCNCCCHCRTNVVTTSVACQTMSTADIVITKVYLEDRNGQKVTAGEHHIENVE